MPSTFVTGYRYTSSQIPTWDSLTTAIYIIAQWMLSQKKIENWILWISADTIMVVMCVWEGLYFTSFQYFVFTIIATLGFLEWRIKLMK
jgi:nicotinamide mononucleotide transporter